MSFEKAILGDRLRRIAVGDGEGTSRNTFGLYSRIRASISSSSEMEASPASAMSSTGIVCVITHIDDEARLLDYNVPWGAPGSPIEFAPSNVISRRNSSSMPSRPTTQGTAAVFLRGVCVVYVQSQRGGA